jgi:ribonuclease BN (tRNA processing enzyme)
MLSLTILGTGSGMPSPGRASSACFLASDRDGVIIDAGEGISRGLAASGIPFDACRRIYISHTHPDHLSGLPMLLQAMRLGGRTTPLDAFVPPGSVDWLHTVLTGMHLYPEEWPFAFRILPLGAEPYPPGHIRVTAFPNRHLARKATIAARHGHRAESYSLLASHAEETVFFSSDIVDMDDIFTRTETSCAIIIDTTHIPLHEIESFAMSRPGTQVVCSHIPPELEHVVAERAASMRIPNLRFAEDGARLVVEGNRARWIPKT